MQFSYFSIHSIFWWQWETVGFIVTISARKLIIFWWVTATYFPYLSFSCFWNLSLKELFLSFWRLRLLCSSSSSLVLALEEWEHFLVPFSLTVLGLSEVFIASMTFLEIWLLSIVIYWPRASTDFSKQFLFCVTSRSWTGCSVISLVFKVSLFTGSDFGAVFWILAVAMINI